MSPPRRTLDELLAAACTRIERHEPAGARAVVMGGALLVDIRSDGAREYDGIVPGSLHVPRTVLEWRLEPGGRWSNPHVGGLERRLVVICDHGFSSIFAAGTLVELGYRAGDVVGGFEAWREAGLPVAPAPPRRSGRPGMGPPD